MVAQLFFAPAQRCGNFSKVATTAVPGEKKAAPPLFFVTPPSLYICQYQPKNTCGGKYKKLPQGGENVFAKIGFRKHHIGTVKYYMHQYAAQ